VDWGSIALASDLQYQVNFETSLFGLEFSQREATSEVTRMAEEVPSPVLIDLRDGGINVIRELGSNEWEEYQHAVVDLRDFDNARMLIPMIEAELSDFRAVIKQANEALPGAPSLDQVGEQFNFEANRRFLSYLAAVRTYLDHTETRLKRHYGPGEPFATFKKAKGLAYDGSFAYRFLYRLRNYGQHCGLPIGHIEVSASATTPGGSVERRATLGFDPRALLLRGGEKIWGKSVGGELAALSGVLDVEPIIQEVTAHLAEIESATLAAERPQLMKAAKPITTLFDEAHTAGGLPAAGILRPTGADTMNIEFARAPMRALTWLGFKYREVVF
jgi:hypothetical protein